MLVGEFSFIKRKKKIRWYHDNSSFRYRLFYLGRGIMETSEILFNVLMFLIFFLIIFIITYFMNVWKYKKNKQIGEVKYLVNKFNLDEKKLKKRQMILWICIIDAFIISFVGTFIFMLPIDYVWKFLSGFVLLFALIYALFEIYGRHLVKSGFQKKGKNEHGF